MLNHLNKKNPDFQIRSLDDPLFKSFGKVLNIQDFSSLIHYMKSYTVMPDSANNYIAHDADFEKSISNQDVFHDVFGDMPLQFGYVNGFNSKLNALEYHKSSEINVAITPLVLMLGLQKDIINQTYDYKNVAVFYIPENTAIEIYPSVLHFSPFRVQDQGFKCAVILPYGTNMNFVKPKLSNHEENLYLFKTNKWLFAHQENQRMIQLGAYQGLIGSNYEILY